MKKRYLFVIICALLTLTTMDGIAEAAKVLKFSSCFPPEFYVTKAYYRIAEKVKNDTNGAIEIKVFHSNQLGSYEQTFQEVMRGTIDMAGNYATPRFNKKFEIASFPYLVSSFDELHRMLNTSSPYSAYMKKCYKECNEVVYLGSFFADLVGCSQAKGKTVSDPFAIGKTKGKTMRVEPTQPKRDWYMAMGYQVATVPYAEVFTSMQTGIIDGNTGDGAEGAYMTLRDIIETYIQYNNVIGFSDFVVSKKCWDSLDKKTQEIIKKAVESEITPAFEEAVNSHNAYIKKMADYGIKIITPTQKETDAMAKLAHEKIWPKYYELLGQKDLEDIIKYNKAK